MDVGVGCSYDFGDEKSNAYLRMNRVSDRIDDTDNGTFSWCYNSELHEVVDAMKVHDLEFTELEGFTTGVLQEVTDEVPDVGGESWAFIDEVCRIGRPVIGTARTARIVKYVSLIVLFEAFDEGNLESVN